MEKDKTTSLDQIERSFKEMALLYSDWEWNWAYHLIEKEEGRQINTYDKDDLLRIIDRWKESVSSIHNMVRNDAAKEFSQNATTGFGIDGDETVRDIDFKEVRGDFETNAVIVGLNEHYGRDMGRADKLMEALRSV